MTLVRLGYSAISTQLQNSSTSKTMTYARFSQIKDREAALRKLEAISNTNLNNLLRLLRYNVANDIHFYRISSKLIPLADHPETSEWNYMKALKRSLSDLRKFIKVYESLRLDFHADHFVLINSPRKEVLSSAIKTLRMHHRLLKGFGLNPEHRCVMHVGGGYGDREKALERFIENWAYVSVDLQEMVILENDDKTFTMKETLYLCEKLGIPLVFDYHHHIAHHIDSNWYNEWDRIVTTWESSILPVKMHISSPKSEQKFRAHADYVDSKMFMGFLQEIKGSVPQIDCMIEAKQKDGALYKLMEDLKEYPEIEIVDGASFYIT
ncbi:UV DNA damage repair endonuclease UvsE [Oceanobacillus bengalensis]|uniref:UV DNA damage repair endonuclease UvsE n=1 Tax=Oceanobacillus bengalensis TaxID=1435466 RepID=A0A494Z4R1_9BACI|nr:UV DNA damage repair endonuclease UvsE [Oceanobacillus bengalensis]RKQ17530.1 UV DNA damage repair endonuclease UvsE [Oceanobacillus bengalensis]